MLGYIGGKQFEEQPWKGILVGLGIAFTVAFMIEGPEVSGEEAGPRSRPPPPRS